MVAALSILAASVGLALVAAQCTNLIENVDFYGYDVGSTSQADAANCCADCDAHYSCKVWVWTSYQGGTCWLKNQTSSPTPLDRAKAGALPAPPLPPAYEELIENVDYWGHDISSTKQKFAQACGEDCDDTEGCQLFVWTSHEGGTCWLKHTYGGQSHLYGAKAARRASGRAPYSATAPLATDTTSMTTAMTLGPTLAYNTRTLVPINRTRAPTTVTPPPPTPSPTTTAKPYPTTAQICPARVRKPWNQLDESAKALFLSALELSMDRGLYQRFLAIHNEMVSNNEAHNSCVFLFWLRSAKVLLRPSQILAVHTNASTPFSSDLMIFGAAYPSLVCADSRPVNHFCPVVEPGARCDRCLPRDATAWKDGILSEEWDVDILKGYLHLSDESPSIKLVSYDIEIGAHGQLHALLQGPMGNPFSSPADPIFYVHHTAVDMLHTIYHHCKIEPLGLSDEGKKSFIGSFEGRKTDNGDDITATSEIKSKVTIDGKLVDAEYDVLVGKYFKDLPSQYWALTDTRDFGARAYSYQFNGLLGRLYTHCGNAMPVESSIKSAHDIDHVVVQVESATEMNQVDYNTAVLAAAAKQGLTPSQVELELRKMALLVKEYCLPGSVKPYSDGFKSVWKIQVRRPSVALLDDLKAGRATMQLAKWRDFLANYFKCTAIPTSIL
ncbi:hypothetical protein H310_10648 [Aphanomyces invadans]|uniref:Tyrosinase copper-binding domain-containing protein n=1 Tax=Aphanomyces invadans TaxID=157072 RepID=A0A024TPQ1_9STRA|nr:hypothetical protein H310_10648 [Aphanomyces invadans]ETV95993.1 hypothetical protein H310_10648 [Aphanomyces invadans]|eukprot:XP_008875304.1 hypothetical protein H310_10648 [Aphanomyces invadans]